MVARTFIFLSLIGCAMTGLLFVTAPEADHKAINRILLYLRDWEYEAGDCFKFVTSKNFRDLELPPGSEKGVIDATSPPVDNTLITNNEWKNASLAYVEEYCIDLDKKNLGAVNTHLYAVVDSNGLSN